MALTVLIADVPLPRLGHIQSFFSPQNTIFRIGELYSRVGTPYEIAARSFAIRRVANRVDVQMLFT
jgi:hypothetical protein